MKGDGRNTQPEHLPGRGGVPAGSSGRPPLHNPLEPPAPSGRPAGETDGTGGATGPKEGGGQLTFPLPPPAKRTVAARASPVEKAAAAVTVGAGSLIAAAPALAEVETRMNGDGTGLILGVNSPILGSVLFVVFAGVWSLFSASAKDFGGQDEDDGLGLD